MKVQTQKRTAGEPLKLGRQTRFLSAAADDMRVERKDNIVRMSFPVSSETEVDRWYGTEILSHEKSAVRMDRIDSGAVPVLFNHNYDMPVGMVESGKVVSNRLVVDTKWLTTDDAIRVEKMVDGGLRNVSLGYRVYAFEEEVKTQRYTAVDWEPFEVSIVTVPADHTVGIGRAQDEQDFEVRVTPRDEAASPQERIDMKIRPRLQNQEGTQRAGGSKVAPGAAAAAAAAADGASQETLDNLNRATDISMQTSAADLDKARVRAIDYFVSANNIPENIRNVWVTSGASLETVGSEIVKIVQDRSKGQKGPSAIGLSPTEVKRFSIARALEAVSQNNNWSKAGFEAECSREIQARIGAQPDPNRFYVPMEVQERQNMTPIEDLAYKLARRDLSVASAGNGGYLVETANIGFVELLRNRSVAFAMGAARMPGMVGNFTIPKQSAAGTAFWLANETTGITESQQTFVQIALSPKTVGGYTEISRQLLLQSSPAAEGLVMSDLAAIVALAADLAILNGSGTAGQPLGILGTGGIGAVTGTSLDYADIIEFQSDTAAGNALFGNSGYVTTPGVAGLLKTRVKFSGTASPLWDGTLLDAIVDGYRGMASNQMPSATMLFGFFGGVIVPEWGTLAIEVNPFANFTAGIIGVRAMYSMDVGVRYPTSFSAASVIT